MSSFGSASDAASYEPVDHSVEADLHGKMSNLCDIYETVKQRVELEERNGRNMVRTPEVGGWLKRVELLLEKEVPELQSHQIRNTEMEHGISNRLHEKRAVLEEKLIEGRGFTTYTYKSDNSVIVEIPRDHIVGGESMFEEVWRWVEDEKVRCIGLFGMGGVGKTTLLNRLHNHFVGVSHDYDFSIMLVVSRNPDLGKIQESILKKLELEEGKWASLGGAGRAALIVESMKKRNFLLFLDDLWDPVDLLNDLGIPCQDHPQKCKIIFTTRNLEVCRRMQPDKIKEVEHLPPDEALQLFRQKLGEDTWNAHPSIPEIAAKLVQECKYLPLALVALARAMAGTTQLENWVDADKMISKLEY